MYTHQFGVSDFYENLSKINTADRTTEGSNQAENSQSPENKKTLKVLIRFLKEKVDSDSLEECQKTLHKLTEHYSERKDDVALAKIERAINSLPFICEFKEALNSKDGDAQYQLSLCYLDGIKIKENKTKAIQLLQVSAQNENADALIALASRYAMGDGVKRDEAKALEYYLQADKLGDTRALVPIGKAYFFGEGVEEDAAKGFEYFAKAAENNDPKAIYWVGYAYFGGKGVEKDTTKGLEYLKIAAKQKDSEALDMLRDYYSDDRDENFGIDYLIQAAQANYPKAQCELGLLYAYGSEIHGIERNTEEGLRLINLAEAKNYPPASFFLGRLYELGNGVEIDRDKAKELYKHSADLNFANAQFFLGMVYKHSSLKDEQEKGFELLQKAANQRHPDAPIQLFKCLRDGIGTPQSHSKAIECLTLYAEQGNLRAMGELGYLYSIGTEGLPMDLKKAVSLMSPVYDNSDEASSKISSKYNEVMAKVNPPIKLDLQTFKEKLHL